MSKLWLVARYEYVRHVLRRSFLIVALSVPLVMVVIVGISVLTRALRDDRPATVGYVDQASLLADLVPVDSAATAPVRWIPLQTEKAAQAALEAEEVQAYYLLPTDYRETHQVDLVYIEEPDLEIDRQFRDLLRLHLLAGLPPEVVHRVVRGSTLVVRSPDTAPGSVREFSGGPTLGQLLPAIAGFALVLLIFVSSGYLMEAVTDEKANRTMEILMTSVQSGQLMAGKVLGIIGVTTTQLVAWILLASLLAWVGGTVLGLEWLREIRVDPPTVAIALAVLAPSYVLVAALMAALGATLVEARSGQQVTMVLITFYMTPMLFVVPILRNLNGPLTVGLSLLPLTAPVVLPLRAAFSQVPFWQIAASVAVQSLCAWIALWLAGRAFRLGTLRYGRRLEWRELFGWRPERPSVQSRRTKYRQGDPVAAPTEGKTPSRNKVLIVLRHELVTVLTRPLFLLTCVGVPLLVLVQITVMEAAFRGGSTIRARVDRPNGAISASGGPGFEMQRPALSVSMGYVDRSGLIQQIPDPVPAGTLVSYPDPVSARQALEGGEIAAFYVIPAEYVESGELICVRPDYSPLSPDDPSALNWTLLVNLLGGDSELAVRVWQPMELRRVTAWATQLRPGEEGAPRTREEESLARLIPMLVMLLLYGVIVMASGLLLNSVSDEKKNRVIEILLLSVSPRQMLTGKIVALGFVGLLQAVVWGGIGYLFFTLRGRGTNPPAGIELPPSLLVWCAAFTLLGYAVYATLMAGAGALVPDIKKAPQVSLLFYLPAFIGFEIGLLTIDNPHGALATGASLFPLTAPFTMVRRLVVGGVPPWQPPLAVVLILVTIPTIARATARVFHAQNLLSGQPFSVKRYWRALLGRA